MRSAIALAIVKNLAADVTIVRKRGNSVKFTGERRDFTGGERGQVVKFTAEERVSPFASGVACYGATCVERGRAAWDDGHQAGGARGVSCVMGIAQAASG